jgi:hypothetical protein
MQSDNPARVPLWRPSALSFSRGKCPDFLLTQKEARKLPAIVRGSPVRLLVGALLVYALLDDSIGQVQLSGCPLLYARQGIAEYWVIDVSCSRVCVYRNPVGGVLREVRELCVGDIGSPQSFPDMQIRRSSGSTTKRSRNSRTSKLHGIGGLKADVLVSAMR